MTLRRAALLAGLSGLASAPIPASAQAYVDQVERLEIELGETEIEGQLVHAWDEAGDDAQRLGFTLERGLSDSLQAGVEIEAARADGETLEIETIGLQAKWSWLDPAASPIGLGAQVALAIDPYRGTFGSEGYLIAEHRGAAFVLVANLVFETEPGEWDEPELAYALRAEREVGERLAFAVEAGGGFAGQGAGGHFAGPVLVLAGDEGEAIELGVFVPLTSNAPDLQVRLEVDFPL